MRSIPQNRAKYICQYILSELRQKLPSHLTYHNYEHTCDVVDVCLNYARVYQLDQEQTELLLIAATAHDYGYVISPVNHEETGADLVSMLMAAYQYKDKKIKQVRNIILATKLGAEPKTLMQKILADADLDYLGRPDYPVISERLFDELVHAGKLSNRSEWLQKQVAFLSSHQYYTPYARLHRRPAKLERLESLRNDLYEYGAVLDMRRAAAM